MDMGTVLLVIALVTVGGALATVVLAVTAGAGETTGVARSLDLIEKTVSKQEVGKADLPAMERLVAPVLSNFRSLAVKLSPGGASESMTRRLDLAGNPGTWTAERIMGAKGVALLLGAVLGLAFGGLSVKGILIAVAAAAVGFFLPDLLLMNAGQKRQEQLRRGLADALDMLTVCVEAGQGFDAALLQVARATTGPISGEFARVLSEIQIGKSRGEAFSSLAQRTTVNEAKTFVSALVQADRLGLPIANVLREQSNQMRIVRRQRAEEKAQKVPVKILFPMLLCIFPALFIVIIGPGAIRIVETFSGGGL
jgi:tight adherence protein C